MRQLELKDAEKHFSDLIAEAEAGQTLMILRANKPVARIVPAQATETVASSDQEDAHQELLRIMNHGYDLGGLKITNRDELYDRA